MERRFTIDVAGIAEPLQCGNIQPELREQAVLAVGERRIWLAEFLD